MGLTFLLDTFSPLFISTAPPAPSASICCFFLTNQAIFKMGTNTKPSYVLFSYTYSRLSDNKL